MRDRRELDQIVLDVELVLISVVQGVALTTLAAEASPVLRSHDWTQLAFVGTGLLFVLSFWSVALVHAISFLAWPMDLVHYFFYFGVALLECLTFMRPRLGAGRRAPCRSRRARGDAVPVRRGLPRAFRAELRPPPAADLRLRARLA